MKSDVNGDGKADLPARSAAGGLYLHEGTGKGASETFATAVKIGTGRAGYHTIV
ncbi:hypothetical protein [Streptomyces sp. NPDC060322]|uniref:hypothetical protein n=1 Tax=Streptomyces sp. NPDC060322 TaxID=3347097 RepID=UPI0036533EEF